MASIKLKIVDKKPSKIHSFNKIYNFAVFNVTMSFVIYLYPLL